MKIKMSEEEMLANQITFEEILETCTASAIETIKDIQEQANERIAYLENEIEEFRRSKLKDYCLIQKLKEENARAIEQIVTLIDEQQKQKLAQEDFDGFNASDFVEDHNEQADYEDYEDYEVIDEDEIFSE